MMDTYIRVYRIAPLPDIETKEFEIFVTQNVLPLVDMEPTRGGQLTDAAFLKEAGADRQDRYLWVIEWEGTNAEWVNLQLEEAMNKLDSVGMRISSVLLAPLD